VEQAVTGVILAGGKNRRMGGTPKALLEFRNERLLHRQIRQLRQRCAEILLVTNDPVLFRPHLDGDIRVIADVYPGCGPLGGMHAAFSAARFPLVWLVGCDMPFISPSAAFLMLQRLEPSTCDAVIPRIGGRLHPLHGIYHPRCADVIPGMLESQRYKIGEFLQRIRCRPLDQSVFREEGIDPRFVCNVNSPEDYRAALALDDMAADPADPGRRS